MCRRWGTWGANPPPVGHAGARAPGSGSSHRCPTGGGTCSLCTRGSSSPSPNRAPTAASAGRSRILPSNASQTHVSLVPRRRCGCAGCTGAARTRITTTSDAMFQEDARRAVGSWHPVRMVVMSLVRMMAQNILAVLHVLSRTLSPKSPRPRHGVERWSTRWCRCSCLCWRVSGWTLWESEAHLLAPLWIAAALVHPVRDPRPAVERGEVRLEWARRHRAQTAEI